MDLQCQVREENNDIRKAMLQPADGNYLETPNYQRGYETEDKRPPRGYETEDKRPPFHMTSCMVWWKVQEGKEGQKELASYTLLSGRGL